MQARKFWIVEYVDVNAPKAERSEICLDKSDARHRAFKRGGLVHFSSLEDFVGGGFCETLRLNAAFYNELRA